MSYKCKKCGGLKPAFRPPFGTRAAFVMCPQCGKLTSEFERVDFEFKELPDDMVEKIDFEGKSTRWSWSTGGQPHSDSDFSILYVAGENYTGPECRFKLPDAISKMLIRQYERGRDDARSAMRRSLGL